ncbi:restriction endonuclease subunit S [Paenibacillus sp. D51F]
MSKVKLSEITSVITKGTTPMTIGFSFQDMGINFVKIESINEIGSFLLHKFQHISEECNDKMKRSILVENDILFSIAGALGRTALVTKDILPANTNQALAIIRLSSTKESCPQYIQYVLKSKSVYNQFQKQKQGVAQLNLSLKNIGDLEIPLPPIDRQKHIAKTLDTASELLAMRKQQLAELDNLIKSTFYDMFGNLFKNEKGWRIQSLLDVATIDTKMTKNFEKYEMYPHIGIDSIEKDTGKIIQYKLVKDSNLISGKYLFSEKHIIYSKIRPNLNKVALPTFSGLCSADAYPILPISGISNRYYLAYILRSEFFLNYILDFSGRTNIPKVNKQQLEGFQLPLPPIKLQNQFATIVTKIEEQKALVKKAIEETQHLFDSLMSEYFD